MNRNMPSLRQGGRWRWAVLTLLLATLLMSGAPPSLAQSESGPEAGRFSGTIFVGAAPAPVGAVVEAWVLRAEEVPCGRAVLAEAGLYRISVASSATREGCGEAGAPVIFRLDGRRTTPDGVFPAEGVATLNLLVGTDPPPPAPPLPRNFALSAFDGDSAGFIYLVWDDRSQLETRFELERWVNRDGVNRREATFTIAANTEEAYDYPGPDAGALSYRLRACRDLVCSAWTEFIHVTVPQPLLRPSLGDIPGTLETVA